MTIIARPDGRRVRRSGEREERDGFAIVRVPIPPGHRLFRLWLRYPWRIANWAVPRARGGLRRMPGGIADVGLPPRRPGVHPAERRARSVLPPGALPEPPAGSGSRPARRRGRPAPRADARPARRLVARRVARPLALGRHSPGHERPRRRAGPADVYHGHDLTGLAAAVAAADLHRSATVVYDSHEIFLESGANADQPGWLASPLARLRAALDRRARRRS